MPLVIGLDFDGTLSPTGADYDRAHLKGALTILEALGHRAPSRKQLFDVHSEIDTHLIQEYQFQVRRIPLSWVETYRVFARETKSVFDPEIARRIYRQTSRALRRGPYKLYDHVMESLEELRAAGHELHLLTIGQDTHQRNKIRAVGLDGYFDDRIHVIAMDKRPTMARIFGGREAESVMVGDSRKSDIEAALDVGAQAIWASYGNPTRHHDAPIDGCYLTIKTFAELPPLIRQLDAR